MTDPIGTPSSIVPMYALAFGEEGQEAQPVTALNPLPVLAGSPDFYQTSGTIAGQGEEVTLECPGTASATIHLLGTFTGTLEVTGVAGDGANDVGGRLIFKSGVGSLGTNKVSISGPHDDEWRVATGGKSVTLRCTDYTSGSLAVVIGATRNPSIMFINGPVRNSIEEATRAGRALLASAPNQAVNSSQGLHVILRNNTPNRILWLHTRDLRSTVGGTQYRAYVNPTTVLTEAGVISPLLQSASAEPGITCEYQVAAQDLSLGGTAASGLPFDFQEKIELLYGIIPGGAVGFSIRGAGGGLNNAATVGVRMEAYWEPVA